MRSLCLAFFLSGSLFGCANAQEYEGPVATVVGTARVVDATTLQSFSIVEISSENVLPHKCGAFAAGQAVPARCIGRDIPAVPMKVKIRGTYVTDTPAQALARKANGTFREVEGVVDFAPVPGGYYEVTGDLDKGGSSVWIEDVMTKLPVTEKLVRK